MHEMHETPDITLKILPLCYTRYNACDLLHKSLDEKFLDTIPFSHIEVILRIK